MIYLDTPACGLPTEEGLKAIQQFNNEFKREGNKRANIFRFEEHARIVNKMADFLSCQPGQICFVPNLSYAWFAAVSALKDKKPKTLLYENDYSSLKMPFDLMGIPVVEIPDEDGYTISEDRIIDTLIKEEIEVLAVSHVQWLSGFTHDMKKLGEFCRKQGIWFMVDATQSIGGVPLFPEEYNIDLMCASNYKWMCAGFGTGVLFARDEFHEAFPPQIAGFGSLDHSNPDLPYRGGLKSYSPGHLSMSALLALEKSLDFFNEKGIANINEHNLALCRYLDDELKNEQLLPHINRESGASFFSLESNDALTEELEKSDIRFSMRNGKARMGFHYYNSEKDVDQLVKCCRNF